MTESSDRLEADRRLLREARGRGPAATLGAFVRLSGPGWLQSAITLGGGSLAGSLYLGVLGGFSFLWLQLVAMLLGVVMLSAIAYVTLSTGERPFDAINRHITPVLGWGWAIATLLANIVWCLPQFSLGTAAAQQNLFPALSGTGGKVVIAASFFVLATIVIRFYSSGGWGVRVFEGVLKAMVGVVVVCFFGVVLTLALGRGLPWGEIAAGFVPDLSLLFRPAVAFDAFLAATGSNAGYWSREIVALQRDVMITAAATAVGINMTFLLPYSMLRKGWDRDFRGLAVFDLSTGLLLPFVLVTSCVVIASATQFHSKYDPLFVGESPDSGTPAALSALNQPKYDALADAFLRESLGAESVAAMNPPERAAARDAMAPADKRMAAMLIKRDAADLATSLAPFTGDVVAHYTFGLGVVGMALSTIIILMLINGFVVCEIFGFPHGGRAHFIGSMVPAVIGASGPFVWSGKTAFWLAVPTSVFGMALLPVAYVTFFLMMNQPRLLGDATPRGSRRLRWNVLMAVAVILAGIGSLYSIASKAGWIGLAAGALFIVAAIVVRPRPRS